MISQGQPSGEAGDIGAAAPASHLTPGLRLALSASTPRALLRVLNEVPEEQLVLDGAFVPAWVAMAAVSRLPSDPVRPTPPGLRRAATRALALVETAIAHTRRARPNYPEAGSLDTALLAMCYARFDRLTHGIDEHPTHHSRKALNDLRSSLLFKEDPSPLIQQGDFLASSVAAWEVINENPFNWVRGAKPSGWRKRGRGTIQDIMEDHWSRHGMDHAHPTILGMLRFFWDYRARCYASQETIRLQCSELLSGPVDYDAPHQEKVDAVVTTMSCLFAQPATPSTIAAILPHLIEQDFITGPATNDTLSSGILFVSFLLVGSHLWGKWPAKDRQLLRDALMAPEAALLHALAHPLSATLRVALEKSLLDTALDHPSSASPRPRM